MVAGEVCCGFFHELKFHLEFPSFPLELAQPCPLAYGKGRFFAGMITAVGGDPVTEGTFVYSELLGYSGDRARCLDHHFHGFVLVFGREALLRSWQNFTFPDFHPNGWTVRKARGTSGRSPAVRGGGMRTSDTCPCGQRTGALPFQEHVGPGQQPANEI